ncbi:MAG: PAS domain-containing protein, partial [Oxalobacteraceae bacterium]
MEMLAIPVFVLDATSRVIIWNRACEGLTGVPSGEVIGTREHWRSFFDQERPTLADQLIRERGGDVAQLHPRTIHAPGAHLSAESWCDMPRVGKRRYLAADASPIFDERGMSHQLSADKCAPGAWIVRGCSWA